MSYKPGNIRWFLFLILIVFLIAIYSCVDVLCPAYTGTSYSAGHNKLPKELRK
jgi:hypothetical protein